MKLKDIELLNGSQMTLEKLMEGFNGFKPVRRLMETQTTSDFPLLFADTIDRQLLLGYKEAPATWRDYVKMATVPDFRTVKRTRVTGLEGPLDLVGEKGEYTTGAVDEEEYTYKVAKYGKLWDISWESIKNDDLGALQDGPQRLGRGARRTEYLLATLLFGAVAQRGAGQFFVNGRNAIIAGGANLDPDALALGYNMMSQVTDSDGQPVFNEPKYLVVPPALALTGRNILSTTIIRELLTTAMEGERANYWSQILELKVNHYLPFVDAVTGNSAWYLFADPADVPAVEVGLLRGEEQPQLFMKAADAIPIGGGSPNPYGGDFATDDIIFKVRHVVGGSRLDWRGAFCSDGV